MLLRYNPLGPDGAIDAAERARVERLEAELVLPVLVVVGTHDRVVEPDDGRSRARTIEGATLVELPTRHSPHLEQPVELAAAIETFVEDAAVADSGR